MLLRWWRSKPPCLSSQRLGRRRPGPAKQGEGLPLFQVIFARSRENLRKASRRIKDTVRTILNQISSLRRDCEQSILTAELEVQSNRLDIQLAGTPRWRRCRHERGERGHTGWCASHHERGGAGNWGARQIAAAAA